MKKRKLFLGILLTLGLSISAGTVQVQAEEIEVFPTCYEDGTFSPVTTDEKVIYANGTSLIFSGNKMYEDLEPYGVLGQNDRRIYTSPYVEDLKDSEEYSGKSDMELDYVYLKTSAANNTQYGDIHITIENSCLRGVYVNHIKNADVNIRNSAVLYHYIENATGNVNYNIENATGPTADIQIRDTSLSENGGVIAGNLTLTMDNVKNGTVNTKISASSTVEGDTRMVLKNSKLYDVRAAHNTGTDTSKGNVYIDAENCQIRSMGGISAGYHRSSSIVNGNITMNVKSCEMELGISDYVTANTENSTGAAYKNVVTGTAMVLFEDSVANRIEEGTGGDSKPEASNVIIKNSTVESVNSSSVTLSGEVIANIETDDLYIKENASLRGRLRTKKSMDMAADFTWKPCYHIVESGNYFSEWHIAGKFTVSNNAKVKVVPLKAKEENYATYGKGEGLPSAIEIRFEEGLLVTDYAGVFVCDTHELHVRELNNYMKLLRHCTKHNWKEAALYGEVTVMEYAEKYNVAATVNKTGIETWYCSSCDAYELRKTEALTKSIAGAEMNFQVVPKCIYNGKAQKPKVVVKDGTVTLKNNQDYTLTYKNNKKIGTATITIKGKGSYTESTVLTFQIIPKSNKITSIKSAKKKQVLLKWKKDKDVTGYIIQYSTDKNLRKNVKNIMVKSNKTTKKTIKGLKSKKMYYFSIASYKKVAGKLYTSEYVQVKKIKVK